MTTSGNDHNMAEALARRLRNIMGDFNDDNVGVETLVRRLVERQQPGTFESPEALATWLESLHECHDDGAVGSRKWEPAQLAARAVRSMGKRNEHADAAGATVQPAGPLSSRLRPGVECAPWVIKEVHRLEDSAIDTARLDWLERHPRLAQVVVDGRATDCYLYGVSGAPGLKLREIIDTTMAQEGKAREQH